MHSNYVFVSTETFAFKCTNMHLLISLNVLDFDTAQTARAPIFPQLLFTLKDVFICKCWWIHLNLSYHYICIIRLNWLP